MELSLKALSLVLGCLAMFSFQFSTASSSPEDQYCGNKKFYCPGNRQCYDRALRCNPARAVCLDSNGKEPKCYESSIVGMYDYQKKMSYLSSLSSSSKKRSIEYFKHWFVEYRGFVYEFGSYGVQELDVNDPNYKYAPGKETVVSKPMGRSRCTRYEIIRFTEKFLEANPKYKLFTNNCQGFASKLIRELRNDCIKNSENLTVQCSIQQQLSLTSATIPRMIFNWKLYALFGPLITFAILHMNYM